MTDMFVEFCVHRSQTSTLSLRFPGEDHPEQVRDVLADALYAAKADWRDGPYAAVHMIAVLGSYYRASLVVGPRIHSDPDPDVVVIDFVSQLVSDRTEGRSYKFGRYLKVHGVPE